MIHPYLVKVSDRAYLDNVIFHPSKMEPVLVGMKFLLPGPFYQTEVIDDLANFFIFSSILF